MFRAAGINTETLSARTVIRERKWRTGALQVGVPCSNAQSKEDHRRGEVVESWCRLQDANMYCYKTPDEKVYVHGSKRDEARRETATEECERDRLEK